MRICYFATLLAVAGCGGAPDTRSDNDKLLEAEGKMWVTTQYADRRTCPSVNCGVVGRLFFREGADVLETVDGWARITKPYDASCANGASEYVDEGRTECSEENGIVNGQFSEWVELKTLSSTRPADPAETAAEYERAIAQSDDFLQHREAFLAAATQLIAEGTCTAQELEDMGGWLKSVNERDRPIYFTYCGGMNTANRLYLNVETGEIYK